MRAPLPLLAIAALLAGCAEAPPLEDAPGAVAPPQDLIPEVVRDGRPAGLWPLARAAMLAEHPDARLAYVRCAEDVWACQDTFGPLDGSGTAWTYGFVTADGREFTITVSRNGTLDEDGVEEMPPAVNAADMPPLSPLPDDPRLFDTQRVAEALRASDPRVVEIDQAGLGTWWYVLGMGEAGRPHWTVGWMDLEAMDDGNTMGIVIRAVDPLTGEVMQAS